MGPIIGAAVVSVLLAVALAILIFLCIRKKRRNRAVRQANLLNLGALWSLFPSCSCAQVTAAEMSQVPATQLDVPGARVDRNSSRVQRWMQRSTGSYLSGVARAPTQSSTHSHQTNGSIGRDTASMYSQASIRASQGPFWHEQSYNNSRQEFQQL